MKRSTGCGPISNSSYLLALLSNLQNRIAKIQFAHNCISQAFRNRSSQHTSRTLVAVSVSHCGL